MYNCYLNGILYGRGDLPYIHSLFTDYVLVCEMYGREVCEFKIEAVKSDKQASTENKEK